MTVSSEQIKETSIGYCPFGNCDDSSDASNKKRLTLRGLNQGIMYDSSKDQVNRAIDKYFLIAFEPRQPYPFFMEYNALLVSMTLFPGFILALLAILQEDYKNQREKVD